MYYHLTMTHIVDNILRRILREFLCTFAW